MCGRAANVQEVGGIPSAKLDLVHCSHCQTGPISHDTDVTLSVDVLQVVTMRDSLFIVDLSPVLLGLQLCLPEKSIVIYNNLGISSHDLSIFSVCQRVYLDYLRIPLDEAVIKMLQKEYHL